MRLNTEQALKLFDSHSRIKTIITSLCYFFIVAGAFIYIFHALNQNNKIKLVKKIKDKSGSYQTEKIMTNPRIKFQYDDNDIYHVQAKKASHKDNQEILLHDVFATGELGNITAGSLEISEEGDHLIFTKNPVLILNNIKKQPKL